MKDITQNIYRYSIKIAIFLLLSLNALSTRAFKSSIIPDINWIWTTDTTGAESVGTLDAILLFFRESIFSLLYIAAVWIIIYIGFILLKAEWNPEEMKKAFTTLIHVVVWLFIVAVSWAIIAIIWGLSF